MEEKRGERVCTSSSKFWGYSSFFLLSPHPAPSPLLLLLSTDLFPSPPLLQQEQTLEVSVHQRTKEEVESRMEELQQRNKMLEEETMAQKHIIHLEKLKTEKVPLTLLSFFLSSYSSCFSSSLLLPLLLFSLFLFSLLLLSPPLLLFSLLLFSLLFLSPPPSLHTILLVFPLSSPPSPLLPPSPPPPTPYTHTHTHRSMLR